MSFEVTDETTKKAIIDEIRDCQKALGRPVITDWKTRGMHKDDLVEILRSYELDLEEEDKLREEELLADAVQAKPEVEEAAQVEQQDAIDVIVQAAFGELTAGEAEVTAEAPEATPEVVKEQAAPAARKVDRSVAEGERWCSWHKCGHPLETDGKPTFSVNNKSKDGLDGRCKVGWSEYKKAHKPAKES